MDLDNGGTGVSRGVTGALTELGCLDPDDKGLIFFLIDSVIISVVGDCGLLSAILRLAL